LTDLPELPARAFTKADPTPDDTFYASPRFVTHIDDVAIAAVTRLYRALFPEGGTVLDLMSSWVSHLPPDVQFGEVIGHGLNGRELDANPRLTRRFVQNLNEDPTLPLAAESVDAAGLCVSVQYLQQPVAVLREVCRVLRPGRASGHHLLKPVLSDQGRRDLAFARRRGTLRAGPALPRAGRVRSNQGATSRGRAGR
jgi:hypothetical protein